MSELLHDDTLGFISTFVLLVVTLFSMQGKRRTSIAYTRWLMALSYLAIGIHVAALAFGQLTFGATLLDLFVLGCLTVGLEVMYESLALQRRRERGHNNGGHV